jgi:SSS family solute:Na+ symporter
VISPLVPLLFLGGILAIIGSPEIWQRILTARNDKVARKSLLISGATMLFWGFLVITIGVFISLILPNSEPSNAFVDFIIGSLPPGVLGLVSVLVISAIMSTADTEIFVACILYKKEVIRTRNKGSLAVKNTRVLIIVFGVISGLGALWLRDLMDVWGVLLNLVYISAPIALSIILGRGGKSRKAKKNILIFSYTLSCLAFIGVAVWVKDFFSWWALAVILSSSLPLLFSGARILETNIEPTKI